MKLHFNGYSGIGVAVAKVPSTWAVTPMSSGNGTLLAPLALSVFAWPPSCSLGCSFGCSLGSRLADSFFRSSMSFFHFDSRWIRFLQSLILALGGFLTFLN